MTLILNRVFVSGLVSGLSLLSAIRPAFAGPVGFPKCFTRTYSKAHLAAHPKQKLTKLTLELSYLKEYDQRNASLKVTFRDAPNKKYSSGAFCLLNDADKTPRLNWNCGIPCDGGGFEVVREADNNVYLKNTRGFTVESDCGGSGNPDLEYRIVESDPENSNFRLEEVPCP